MWKLVLLLLAALASLAASEAAEAEFCRKRGDEDDCEAPTGADLIAKIRREVNTLPALLAQDAERTGVLMTALDGLTDGGDDARVKDRFFQVVSMVLQTHCAVGKRIGGKWRPQCGYFLGDSFLCVDKLYEDEGSDAECLVYSFATGEREWTFEKAMASMGCRVRAFDPLAVTSDEVIAEGVEVAALALGHESREVKVEVKAKNKRSKWVAASATTLEDALAGSGDADREVSYLKVDVAGGAEIAALPQMLKSGALKHVRQLQVTFHTGPSYLDPDTANSAYADLLRTFQSMHSELGFRLVHYSPDGCVAKSEDPARRYYTNFDVLWYRPTPMP